MKVFSRVELLLRPTARLLSSYLGLTIASMRWQFVNDAPTLALSGMPQGYIVCFWHGRISLSVVSQRIFGAKRANAMISLSSDGELVARLVEKLGYPAVRGSRGKDGVTDKGGAGAFRQALRLMRRGEIVAITPDGPRGPVEVMPPGPVVLARTAKVPAFMLGIAAWPTIRPGTWDRMRVPLPFGRGAMVIDGPLFANEADDEASVAATAADWGARLCAAQASAEAIVSGRTA